jgi:hypothetical protein
MEAHRLNHVDQRRWQSLNVGQEITLVKLSPNGDEAARYPAVLVARDDEDYWVAFQARWTYKRVELDGLIFEPGDTLIEWFSPIQPFNAFAVLSSEGRLRGWYANVTYPAYLEPPRVNEHSLTLVWHDLYLDLVGLSDASYVMRDEDELAESGLETSDPLLHGEIVAAGDELIHRFTSHQMPFRLHRATRIPLSDPRQSQE